jgi:hypothetical protein
VIFIGASLASDETTLWKSGAVNLTKSALNGVEYYFLKFPQWQVIANDDGVTLTYNDDPTNPVIYTRADNRGIGYAIVDADRKAIGQAVDINLDGNTDEKIFWSGEAFIWLEEKWMRLQKDGGIEYITDLEDRKILVLRNKKTGMYEKATISR